MAPYNSLYIHLTTVVYCDCPSSVDYIYTGGNVPKFFEVQPICDLKLATFHSSCWIFQPKSVSLVLGTFDSTLDNPRFGLRNWDKIWIQNVHVFGLCEYDGRDSRSRGFGYVGRDHAPSPGSYPGSQTGVLQSAYHWGNSRYTRKRGTLTGANQ